MKLNIPEINQLPQLHKILDDMEVKNNVFLVGSTGTGKTTLAELVAYVYYNRDKNDGQTPPFEVINCSQYTSPTEIIGGQTPKGYQEGRLIKAWGEGKMLILDELPKQDPNTAGLLNDALAKTAQKGAIIFNGLGEPIVKHDDFLCIATGNILGSTTSSKYVGNNQQDASLLDRFSSCVYEVGFNEELEKKLTYTTVFEICNRIRKAIQAHEGQQGNESETTMTLRTMLNMQRIYEVEMLRVTQTKNKLGKKLKINQKGKTFKDALESYFYSMNTRLANDVKEDLEIETFYNSYKSKKHRDEFVAEYLMRKK